MSNFLLNIHTFITSAHFALQVCQNVPKRNKTRTRAQAKKKKNTQKIPPPKKPLLSCSCVFLNLSHFGHGMFWESRSYLLPEIRLSSIYAFVFLSALWEWMTNDTEGSTSRSPERRGRYDLSLRLTCAISLHTYSNSRLNPSLSPHRLFHRHAFAFPLFLIYITG